MKFPRFNFKLFTRKILSLGFAAILWFFVTENSILLDQKTVDVQYKGLPDNVIMVESLQKVSYTLSKNPYYPADIKITVTPYVEIKDSTPGWHTFPVKLEFSSPLPSYANVNLSVNSARVLLDNKSVKNVLLKPDIEVINPADFSVTNVRVTPSITQLTGPESVLDKINNIFLDGVSVNRAGDFKMPVNVLSPSTSITVRDTKVSLQFSVYSNYITKMITLPISYKNLPVGFNVNSINIKEVNLRLKGLKSQFDAISNNPGAIVFLDLINIDSNGFYPKVPLHIELPDDMTLLNIRSVPNNIDITINTVDNIAEVEGNVSKNNDKNLPKELDGSLGNERERPKEKDTNMPFLLEVPALPNTETEREQSPVLLPPKDKVKENTQIEAIPEKKDEALTEKYNELDDNQYQEY